jgi:hypothetical protein
MVKATEIVTLMEITKDSLRPKAIMTEMPKQTAIAMR